MSHFFSDCFGVPGTGLSANLHSVVCNAPKGAKNQYSGVSYYGDSSPQPTGEYILLETRFHLPSVVVAISG